MNFSSNNGMMEVLSRHFLEMNTNQQTNSSGGLHRIVRMNEDLEGADQTETRIERQLNLSATASSYMDEGKYEEAYVMVKKQYKLGPSVNFASILIKCCVCLMKTERPEKAKKIRDELLSLVRNELKAEPDDVNKYAKQLNGREKYFEAILFSSIAASLFASVCDPANAINGLQRSSRHMFQAILKVVKRREVTKEFAKRHFLAELRSIRTLIGGLQNLDKKLTCLVEAVCLHEINVCELVVDDHDARIATTSEAIRIMTDALGEEANKHQIFSTHLNNLGVIYMVKGRHDEARNSFKQAIAAMKKATDYSSEAERMVDIQKAEMALNQMQI